jgi:hypothetical protein
MPYTKAELENVDFYKEFVDKLRNEYLDEMRASSNKSFRKKVGDVNILQSFEDIFTGLGIETVDVVDSIYSFLYIEDYSMYTYAELTAAKNDPDISLSPIVTDKRLKQWTKHNGRIKRHKKGRILDKVIDRVIEELYITTESTLPQEKLEYVLEPGTGDRVEGSWNDGTYGHLKNWDIVTYKTTETDERPLVFWLIHKNKKRQFLNKTSYFKHTRYTKKKDGSWRPIKVKPVNLLNKIDNGEIII